MQQTEDQGQLTNTNISIDCTTEMEEFLIRDQEARDKLQKARMKVNAWKRRHEKKPDRRYRMLFSSVRR